MVATPTKDYQFSTESLSGDITFARSGATATIINSSGQIDTVAADTARFNHNDTGAFLGLLVEGGRTNYIPDSDDFTTWTNSLTTDADVTGSVTAPGSSFNVFELTEQASAGAHRIDRSVTTTFDNQTVFAAGLFKLNTRYRCQVQIDGNVGSTASSCNLDGNLSAGTINSGASSGNISIQQKGITKLANGWYRVWFTATLTGTCSGLSIRLFILNDAGTKSYTGDGSSSLYISGADLQISTTPSSHIPTSGGTSTRNTDDARITPISGFFNSSAGSLCVKATLMASYTGSNTYLAAITDGSSNNHISIRRDGTSLIINVVSGGAGQAYINCGTWSVGETKVIALSWAANDVAVSVNGSAVSTDTSVTLPTGLDRFRIGAGPFGIAWNGPIQFLKYWDSALSDADLIELSANTIGVTAGSYTQTGIAANPEYDRLIAAVASSYALTGQEATPIYDSLLTAGAGSYTLSGVAANTEYSRNPLAAGTGSYVVSGVAAALLGGYVLPGAAGSYTLSGLGAGTIAARVVSAAAGSYTLSGQAAAVLYDSSLVAATGSYTLTGVAAALEYAPSALVAEAGSYTLSGQAVALEGQYVVAAGVGAYTLSGQAAQLIYDYSFSTDVGSYILTGNSATVARLISITAAAGSYTLSGVVAGFDRVQKLLAEAGSYTISGAAATFEVSTAIISQPDDVFTVPARGGAMYATAEVRAGYTPPGKNGFYAKR